MNFSFSLLAGRGVPPDPCHFHVLVPAGSAAVQPARAQLRGEEGEEVNGDAGPGGGYLYPHRGPVALKSQQVCFLGSEQKE